MRQWLVNFRENKHYTQFQLAKIVSTSRAHYTNIESGLRRPSPELAQKIASELSFDWRLFFETEKEVS